MKNNENKNNTRPSYENKSPGILQFLELKAFYILHTYLTAEILRPIFVKANWCVLRIDKRF